MIRVAVPLVDRSYDVLVGAGARHELPGALPGSTRRAVVVTQAAIPLAVDPGVPYEVVTVGSGEEFKSMATVSYTHLTLPTTESV